MPFPVKSKFSNSTQKDRNNTDKWMLLPLPQPPPFPLGGLSANETALQQSIFFVCTLENVFEVIDGQLWSKLNKAARKLPALWPTRSSRPHSKIIPIKEWSHSNTWYRLFFPGNSARYCNGRTRFFRAKGRVFRAVSLVIGSTARFTVRSSTSCWTVKTPRNQSRRLLH